MESHSELPVILIAENDPSHTQRLEQGLRAAGWRNPMGTFSNGAELIDFLRKACFASPSFNLEGARLLFLDLNISPVDGRSVIAWIRRHSLAGIRIVVMSDIDESLESMRPESLGADRWLRKPAGEAELRAELADFGR